MEALFTLAPPDDAYVVRDLPIVVERDYRAKTFTATLLVPELSWIWGHGDTVDEARQDCVTSFIEQTDFLAAHKDELGAILHERCERLERWMQRTGKQIARTA